MIYKEYGRAGIKVSAVGFGGMRFDLKKSNEENAELLLYAREKGVNYFDTAPGYCEDKSEDIFGIALDRMSDYRDEFYVSTKGMPTEFDTADKARGGVEKSLKRLNCDYLDFYHVWCIRSMAQYELAMKKGGQYDGLMKCKEEGLIKNIVISTHLPGNKIERIINDDNFVGVLMGVNILNFPYRWQGVEAAYNGGYGVVAMNPLSGGMIPKFENELGYLAAEGETPVEAAIRFCVSCPQITITLIGFTTKQHIDTACDVAAGSKPFTQEDIERVKSNVSENMNAICTGCGYCMKCCEKEIPVANYMQAYNDKAMFHKSEKELIEETKFHHEWGLLVDRKASAADCIQCGKCEAECTQHLNIIERLGEMAEWEAKI
ncbi:MAG: aldo/keto reductase [Planctomycetes bacterium]|nr:aldo/keto reductase [Planctomycetota bacterium]